MRGVGWNAATQPLPSLSSWGEGISARHGGLIEAGGQPGRLTYGRGFRSIGRVYRGNSYPHGERKDQLATECTNDSEMEKGLYMDGRMDIAAQPSPSLSLSAVPAQAGQEERGFPLVTVASLKQGSTGTVDLREGFPQEGRLCPKDQETTAPHIRSGRTLRA